MSNYRKMSESNKSWYLLDRYNLHRDCINDHCKTKNEKKTGSQRQYFL